MNSTKSIIPLNPAILGANYFQFGRGQRIFHPEVLSRMFVWCKAGRGEIMVNGIRQSMALGAYCFTPFKHSITYQSDKNEPLLIGCIHVIPFHPTDRPIVFQVPHHSEDKGARWNWRKDIFLPGLADTPSGIIADPSPLTHLADFIIKKYQHEKPSEPENRKIAKLFIKELIAVTRYPGSTSNSMPPVLQELTQYVTNHINASLGLRELSEFSRLSHSAVGRTFKKHLNKTPIQWITEVKLREAKNLLATTHLQVAEIGKRVGIDDPYYFSKLFKKHTHQTPLAFRRNASVL